jgi:hypothetical protein
MSDRPTPDDLRSAAELAKLRAKLATELHRLADYIGGDRLESPPISWLLVLEGERGQHEVLWSGTLTRTRLANSARTAARATAGAKGRPVLKLFAAPK